jgi:hypothetical protein
VRHRLPSHFNWAIPNEGVWKPGKNIPNAPQFGNSENREKLPETETKTRQVALVNSLLAVTL